MTRVPPPGGLSTASLPPCASTRSASPRRLRPGPDTARRLVAASLVYALAMVVRYVVRMTRRPSQRWFGGAIPIAFHLVLAAALLVLGWANLG